MWIHSLKVAKRVILIVIGFTLLVAGIVMSVPLVPGPGLLVVIAALAILAVEFVWRAGCWRA
jgi:predicted tellurium resistance membrane protein TerC